VRNTRKLYKLRHASNRPQRVRRQLTLPSSLKLAMPGLQQLAIRRMRLRKRRITQMLLRRAAAARGAYRQFFRTRIVKRRFRHQAGRISATRRRMYFDIMLRKRRSWKRALGRASTAQTESIAAFLKAFRR
jgi:hypothetical protein